MPKLILVEDHDILRHGLRSLLDAQEDFEIVGEARDAKSALDLCERVRPDLVLMELNMPLMNGLECTRMLKRKYPDLKVLVLSMHEDEKYLGEMVESGANGYLLKNSCKDELIVAIKKVMSGQMYVSSEFTQILLDKYRNSGYIPGPQASPALSDGESKILELIAEGLTNTQMANKLYISVRTVESRRKKLLDKTGTTNTATLIKYAVKTGLIK